MAAFLSVFFFSFSVSTCHANAFLCSPDLHGSPPFCILALACVGKLDLPAVSRGPSPLPEPPPVGDIVTGELVELLLS